MVIEQFKKEVRKKGMRILNAGSGWDTFGTDLIDIYPMLPNVKKCNLSKDRFPYKDNTFDEVYSRCNFEHLTNPAHFLEESFRVLKPGGRIKIITDNAGYFGLIGRAHTGGYEEDHKEQPNDRHYMVFTKNHLYNWLDTFGFRQINIEGIINPNSTFQRIAIMFTDKLYENWVVVGRKPSK